MLTSGPVRGVGMRPFPFGPPFSPAPQGFFFGSPFFVSSGFFFGFSSGFGRNAFFGGFGFPLFTPTSCFFNGFSNVCFAQPLAPVFLSPTSFNPFFSPLGFAPFGLGPIAISPFDFSAPRFCPFGFNRFGLGAFGAFSGLNDVEFSDNSAAAPEPAPESRDWGPYTYQPAPELSSQAQPATQSAQAFESEEQGSSASAEQAPPAQPFALIFLTDGTNYQVSDYWVEGGRLHYVTSYGGENSIATDRLDLQRTVDENWKNGVQFTLRPSR